MKPILDAMGTDKWLAGELTYIDFCFFELLQLLIFASGGKVLEEFPVLKTYNENFKKIDGFAEFIEDPDCPVPSMTFNNKVAKFNGKLAF